MSIQLSPEQEHIIHQVLKTGRYNSVDEVLDSAFEAIRQREGVPPDLTRSQLAGQRIRELRRDITLGGLSIRSLIEEGRE